jgi:hypothetical protein
MLRKTTGGRGCGQGDGEEVTPTPEEETGERGGVDPFKTLKNGSQTTMLDL